jgi:glycine cleavage system H protein
MKSDKLTKENLFYTTDHEWIDFQSAAAYVGVSSFKLIGFREIQQVIFSSQSGIKNKGDLIATIKYNDYQIEVNMPVDGKLIRLNTDLIYGEQNLLLKDTGNSCWIAQIIPLQPDERKDLLLPKQYQKNSETRNVKVKS